MVLAHQDLPGLEVLSEAPEEFAIINDTTLQTVFRVNLTCMSYKMPKWDSKPVPAAQDRGDAADVNRDIVAETYGIKPGWKNGRS